MGSQDGVPDSSKYSILIRCLGHKSIKIQRGDTIKVGRHGSNDLVLRNKTVSRFHASIVWDPDEDRPYVVDHKSANGIEVDGNPVEERSYLTGDNHIDVGDFTLVLEFRGTTRAYKVGAEAMIGEDDALLANPTVVRLFSERGKEFDGKFESVEALKRVFLSLEDDERTGTLTVRSGARVWKVTISQGRIVTAVRGNRHGLETLKEVVQIDRGSYEFTRDLEPSEDALNISVRHVFLEESGTTKIVERRDPPRKDRGGS